MSSKLLSRRRPKRHSHSVTSTTSTTPESPQRDGSPCDSPTAASTPSDTGTVPQNVTDAFAEVHPSLVEYLSLFPQASLAVVDPSQQPYTSAATPTATASTPMDTDMQPQFNLQAHVQPAGMTATSLANTAAAQYPQLFGNMADVTQAHIQQPHVQPHGQPSEPMNFAGDGLSMLNMSDMGFTEDVMMSEHWMNLMRETGILDSNGNFAGVQNGDFLPQDLMF